MTVPRWLRQYWQERLLPVLEVADASHPEPLQEVFTQTLADWRSRPTGHAANTIAHYVTLTRAWVRELPLTSANQVMNPKTGQPEHVALMVFSLTPEEWAAGKQQSMQRVQERNVAILPIADPGPVLETIGHVLSLPQWEAVAAGLAAATGRRIGEVLLSGSLVPRTDFTVLFVGRLKMQGRPDQRFEIPTIVEAERVLQAWERLRTHPDLAVMDLPTQVHTRALGELNQRLYPRVRRAVAHFFGDQVPGLDEAGAAVQVSTHRLRSLYAALAVWAYCPPWVDPDRYAAAVLGHGLFAPDGTEQLNPATEEYYHRYVIQDGRRGVRLGEPGVVVLERFARPPAAAEQVGAEGTTSRKRASKKKRHEPPTETKTGFSSLRPTVSTRRAIFEIAQELGVEWQPDDVVLKVLVQTYREHQQRQPQPPVLTPDALGLDQNMTQQVLEATRLSGDASFDAFVRHAVERESRRLINFAESVKARQQQRAFDTTKTSALEGIRRAPEANERLRRAIATVVEYNLHCTDPNLLWYVNQKLLRDLTGAAPGYINRILEANTDFLAQHHTSLSITPAHNRIPTKPPLREVLRIPELPSDLPSLSHLVIPELSEGER